VNIAWTVVVVIVVGWSLVSILVALAFGGLAKGRDEAGPLFDDGPAPARVAPPLYDEDVRAAV
jgi:hypothetical protein